MNAAERTSGRSVLIIDPDPGTADVLTRCLTRDGYRVRCVASGSAALAMHEGANADLVVMETMLPGLDGAQVLRALRRHPSQPAILVLTSRVAEADLVSALKGGADHFMTKPFSPRELMARIEAVLRRRSAVPPVSVDPRIEIGDLSIDVLGRRVMIGAESIALTRLEFDLLVQLASRPGVAQTRGDLLRAVWGYDDYTDTSTVTVHVRRLRTKLERRPGGQPLIHTAHGVGYRFQMPPSPVALVDEPQLPSEVAGADAPDDLLLA